jgi:acyl-CoA hydrolase
VNTFAIVRQEHLSHNGYLFGGQLLKWVDEFAFIVASRDFTGRNLVTRAMDRIDFKTRIVPGSILRFSILPERIGTSAATYAVEVWADAPGATDEKLVFSVNITFVAVSAEGGKTALGQRSRPLPSERDDRSI